MIENTSTTLYLEQPFPLYFLIGLAIVNCVALFHFNPLYIGSFLSFLYILITPGFLLLPFLSNKKFPPMLGIAFSAALSILLLMLVGLTINTVLPLIGIHAPLNTIPLLLAFDLIVYLLLVLNYECKKNSPFEWHGFDAFNWTIASLSFLLPVCACLGAIILNNNGPDFLAMFLLALSAILVPIIIFNKKVNQSIPPFNLCMMALAFLLSNSMRGWFITGHDILLEYHVFTLTNAAHFWSMSLYQDPYMACLSLTILPTYIQSLIHVTPAYIFKFFTQFIGAIPVVVVYYLTKYFSSEKIAYLAGFLYITFPTFMVDMAFLNRQGIAFVFFGTLLLTLLTADHFSKFKRTLLLFLLGTGMILSHYSTSYIAIPILIGAYVINILIRALVKAKKPEWLSRLTSKLGNRVLYERPVLLTLPFVIGLLAIMILWSTVITKTSNNLFETLQQIVASLEHPFELDASSGPAKYSLVTTAQMTPQQLFKGFYQQGLAEVSASANESEFYPTSVTSAYSVTPVSEPLASTTVFGEKIQSFIHVNLNNFYNELKQIYAKILQILLIIGLLGLMLGYAFKRNVTRDIPTEYMALSIAGICIMVGQTVLPASAVDYGLLRLFQQNLIFLALPIILGLILIISWFTRNKNAQLAICTAVLLFFFIMFSGLFSQFTGGGRPLLSLNNDGLYYDSYYMHAQEVYAINWMNTDTMPGVPVQAAHFSDIKMIAYGKIAPHIELLPETTKKDDYVYLNFTNVNTGNIIEYVNSDVLYYHFPLEFLASNKDLIYNDGGSEIYK